MTTANDDIDDAEMGGLMGLLIEQPTPAKAGAEGDEPQADTTEGGVPQGEPEEYDAGADGEGAEPPAKADETDDEGDGQDQEPAAPTFRVKVDGEEVEATLDDLKRSYAGQGYIQKRMQEVAAVRKEAEAVYTALNQERAQLAAALAAYQEQMLTVGVPQAPSKELLATDPIRYLEEEVAYREAVQQREKVQAQQQALLQQQSETNARAHQAYLAAQAQELVARIPDFGDAKKAAKVTTDLARVGQEYGYSVEDLQAVSDARAINVLYDAMRYRQLMGQKSQIAAKTEGARPAVRPGAKQPTLTGQQAQAKKVRARMRETGRVEDVAEFLMT